MSASRWALCLILFAQSVLATQFGDIPVTQVIGTPSITNDSNITLTLGGTPTDALLKPFSITVGWTGLLPVTRGGTGAGTAGAALTALGAQPLDGDLTALAALTGTNTIYYRSATDTWTAVTIGGNMTFSGGTLNSVGGAGNVSNSGTPTLDQTAVWTDATHIKGVTTLKGGTTGQVLKKNSNTDYDYLWGASGGTGTVTDFSAGDLSPLFTTTEATTTTTPALSFVLTNAGATTVFGRAAGTSGAPTYSSSPQFTAIGNLTTNGFVKTGGGVGTLSVDTSTYLTGNQSITLSGDVSGTGSTAITTAIGANKVTLGMMATMATDSILGRATAAAGNVEVLGALPFAYTGDVTRPADSNVTTLAAGNAGNLNSGTLLAARMPALTGDVTTTIGTVATTIANDAVTFAKFQNITDVRLLGRNAGSAGDMQEISLGTNLSFTGTTLNATGGGGVSVADPGSQLLGLTKINGSAATAMRSDGAPALDQSIAPTWTGLHTFKITDASTTSTPVPITLGHNSTGSPAAGFGAQLSFQAKSATVADRDQAAITALWMDPLDVSRDSAIWFYAVDAGTLASKLYLYGNGTGSLSLGFQQDPGSGIMNAEGGYKTSHSTPASGKFLQSDGTAHKNSTLILPITATTAGSIMQSSGASTIVMSTPTWPTAAGTSGNVVLSNGTNFTSSQLNFSNLAGNWTLAQGPSITAAKLLGRDSASAGIPQEITLGTNLSMSGTTLNAAGGAGGTPGGSNTQVQFNDSSAFGGDADFTWDKTNNVLGLSSGALLSWNADTALYRNAAGIVEINSGTAGTYRDLLARRVSAITDTSPGTGFYINNGSTNLAAYQAWTTGTETYTFFTNNKHYVPGTGWADLGNSRTGSGFQFHDNGILFHSFNTGTTETMTFNVNPNVVSVSGLGFLGFTNSGDPTGAQDTAFYRNAAGIVEINNGSSGTFRDLKLRNAILNPQASAPSGIEGMLYGNSTDHKVYYHNGTSFVDLTAGGAGGGSPGGANTNVQYNASGAFAGDAEFTWDTSNKNLGITVSALNSVLGYQVQNSNAGSAAQAVYIAKNGTYQANYGITGTGLTAAGDIIQNQAYLYTDASQGLGLFANSSGAAIKFAPGGITFQAALTTTPAFQLANNGLFGWSSTTTPTAALDTALGRSSPGVVEVNNGTAAGYRDLKARNISLTAPTNNAADVLTTNATQTLTNKRVNPRENNTNSTSSLNISTDNVDQYDITAQAIGLTLATPTGTPVQGQKLILRIKDDGTSRSLTWTEGSAGAFRFSSDLPKPTATVAGKTLYMGFIYNATDSRWDCVSQLGNF